MLKSLRVVAPIVGATGVSIALSMSAHADVDVTTHCRAAPMRSFSAALPNPRRRRPSGRRREAVSGTIGVLRRLVNLRHGGNAPCDAPLQVLTTPEVFEFGPSSLQDETDIISAVEAEYAAGDISATDPLTVFAYSQSVIAASAAEKVLAATIPQDDLHFVFIGDPSDANGIATNIYSDLVQLFGGGTTGTTLTERRSHRDQRRPIRPRRLACR